MKWNLFSACKRFITYLPPRERSHIPVPACAFWTWFSELPVWWIRDRFLEGNLSCKPFMTFSWITLPETSSSQPVKCAFNVALKTSKKPSGTVNVKMLTNRCEQSNAPTNLLRLWHVACAHDKSSVRMVILCVVEVPFFIRTWWDEMDESSQKLKTHKPGKQ